MEKLKINAVNENKNKPVQQINERQKVNGNKSKFEDIDKGVIQPQNE